MKKAISLILAFYAFNLSAQTPTPMASGQYNYTHANYKATAGRPLGVINGTTGQYGAIQSVDTIWFSGDSIKFKIAGVTYGALSQNLWRYDQIRNIIYSYKNDSTSLLFGADTISTAGNTGVYFNKTKLAFRVGQGIWVEDSLGLGSTAIGNATTASGDSSTAIGNETTSTGFASTAIGYATTASGDGSTSMGNGTTAIGDVSTAMGINTTASGNASTAIGYGTTASGDGSTSMGNTTIANGYASLVVGRFNDTLVGAETAMTDTTPLFIVGNGTSSSDLHNAFVVRNNGTVEIDSFPHSVTGDSIVRVGANGILTKVNSNNFWKTGGNTGLDTASYLGTNDSLSLVFKVVSQIAGRLSKDSAGIVSFGKYSAVETTGGSNTAFGWSALRSTTTGNDNTAIGNSVLRYSTGNQNTAIGARALSSLVTGSANVAIGRTSLQMATKISSTVSIGTQAMQNRVSGAENTAIGHTALLSDTNGGNNTAVGSSSMRFHIGGSDNTAVGRNALFRATSGSQNTGIGSMALDSVTGSNNIGIGYQARVPNNAASNQIRLGNSSITYAGIEVAWTVTSDSSAKTNVTTSNLGLGFINSLRSVSYNRKTEEGYFPLKEYGLIAQEVKQALATAGVTDSGVVTEAGEGKLAVRYNDLISVLIKAVQELTERVETLENQ